MDPRAEALWRWFLGKTAIYVVQQPDGHYLTNAHLELPALSPEAMEAHVSGLRTIAIYTVAEDHTVGFGMIDFDSKTAAAKERMLWIKNYLKQTGLPSYIEASGSKGYHLWVVFKARIHAAKVNWLLNFIVKQAAEDLGDPGASELGKYNWIEVNPKQKSGAGAGNAVKLPWGIHKKTGQRTTFISENFSKEVNGKLVADELPNHGLDTLDAQDPITSEVIDEIIAEFCPMPTESEEAAAKKKRDWEHSEEFQDLAVGILCEKCTFIQHCRDHATTLSEPHWWGMMRQLLPFGEPGRRKVHDLSAAYPKYTERETDKKINDCLKATDKKEVGPHTCLTVKGFFDGCPEDCWAVGLGVASPAGMAAHLAAQDMAKARTDSISVGKKGKEVKVNCVLLAEEIMKVAAFKTFRDTEEVLIYRDGIYQLGGETIIKEMVEDRLGQFSNERRANEVIYHVRVKSYASRDAFNAPGHIVNLKNGLLDLDSGELKPHSPDFLGTIRIPVAFDEKATCPTITKFLSEVLPPANIPTFIELCGYCLESDYYIARAFLFTGEGANGKSVAIELLRTFLGTGNCTTVPLQFLENSRFASSGLYGKLANLYADLPTTAMSHVGTFKMLTGGDFVHAEKKFGNAFDFKNVAKLVFSANQVPEVRGEDSLAFWRRWILVRFPNQFLGDKADKHLIRKLTTAAELSGFLNIVLQGLQGLRRSGEFSGAMSPDQTQEAYTKAASPIVAFITEACEITSDGWTTKDILYGSYKVFCEESNLPIKGKDSFGRSLAGSIYGNQIKSGRRRLNGELTYVWEGISLSCNVQNMHNSLSLPEPKQEHFGEVTKMITGASDTDAMVEQVEQTDDNGLLEF